MLDLRTGKEMTRRETIKGGLGLAAILAAGKAPAYLLGARGVAFGGNKKPYDREVEYLKTINGAYLFSEVFYSSSNKYLFEVGISASSGLSVNYSSIGWDAGGYIRMFPTGFNNGYTTQTQIIGDVYSDTKVTLLINSGTGSNSVYTFGSYGSNQRPHQALSTYASTYAYPLFAVVSKSLYLDDSVGIRHSSFRAWVNDSMVHDWIPVSKDNVGYFFDKANPNGGPNGNGLYGNIGTGYFDFPGRV